ncbi:helix-turn-helix transcriptional regulator [Rheinheimera maricola]|uniref:AlpA family phage regulatory protein n=1 Tax=Rheinheimera maricola TaxID=2793282 RepID=A0ABS7XC16_9GAMM|nr:AlpA family phage regulatory protein [Gammaproteobacteria bacterium]MBU2205776.1 AlpA family phage regulatory protein [Gammaproteobacteria bacterium]MBZ9612710.1 AlpA family phage regulatory protein [Rheinheimera maricola]
MKDVTEIVGMHRSTIYKRINEGSFPKAISIGGRSIRFLESSIRQWMLKNVQPN